jgi:hypothetical protein
MTQDDPVDQALRAYQVPAPPPDLAERVARAISGGQAAARGENPGRRRWRRALSAVALVGAAAGIAVPSILVLRPQRPELRAGASAPAARETLSLGGKAILVAEAGASVRWWPGPAGGLLVEQSRGDVFYRVDSGPFTVETPGGTVRVRGTCFRVEVTDMKLDRQTLAGAAAGAALASAVVVTVYEGRVSLANGGGQIEVPAGESAILPADRSAPHLSGERPAAGRAAPPVFQVPASAVPEEQAGELAALRARVAEQEKEIARLRTGHPHTGNENDFRRFLDPSPEELQARVGRCELAFVSPNLDRLEPATVSAKQARELGLTDTERDAVDEVMKEIHAEVPVELRKLYQEMSGDSATANRLSASSLLAELQQKSPAEVHAQARVRISRERAGLLPPPTSPTAGPPLERALRLMAGLADDFERRLGERIGPQRARGLRDMRRSWGNQATMNGCPRTE